MSRSSGGSVCTMVCPGGGSSFERRARGLSSSERRTVVAREAVAHGRTRAAATPLTDAHWR
jgi:hypothetical protein